MMNDLLRFVSHLRDQARQLPIVETAALFPFDDLHAGANVHFDPVSCQLVDP
jgi:hypothetical protein